MNPYFHRFIIPAEASALGPQLFYAFLSPDNGGTEGGAKTIESTTELFYVQRSGTILNAEKGSTEHVSHKG